MPIDQASVDLWSDEISAAFQFVEIASQTSPQDGEKRGALIAKAETILDGMRESQGHAGDPQGWEELRQRGDRLQRAIDQLRPALANQASAS